MSTLSEKPSIQNEHFKKELVKWTASDLAAASKELGENYELEFYKSYRYEFCQTVDTGVWELSIRVDPCEWYMMSGDIDLAWKWHSSNEHAYLKKYKTFESKEEAVDMRTKKLSKKFWQRVLYTLKHRTCYLVVVNNFTPEDAERVHEAERRALSAKLNASTLCHLALGINQKFDQLEENIKTTFETSEIDKLLQDITAILKKRRVANKSRIFCIQFLNAIIIITLILLLLFWIF